MAERLSGKLSRLIHQMGRDREDRIISGETKLTVEADKILRIAVPKTAEVSGESDRSVASP